MRKCPERLNRVTRRGRAALGLASTAHPSPLENRLKLFAFLAIPLTLIAVIVLSFLAGAAVNVRAHTRKGLREAGFTKETVRLHRQAMRILKALVETSDFNADDLFATDRLSNARREQIEKLLAEYEKEITKV